MSVKKIPARVPMNSRVLPSARAELERLAARHNEHPGTLAQRVLEAFAEGRAYCRICYAVVPFEHRHHGGL